MCDEQIICDAYDKRIIIVKVGETHALSAKTGLFSLANWTI
jgi:hypothetical protein